MRILYAQVTELKQTVHRYESGIYGLADATRELREAKEQLTIRDDHIADLIQQLNHLELGNAAQSQNHHKFTNFRQQFNILKYRQFEFYIFFLPPPQRKAEIGI